MTYDYMIIGQGLAGSIMAYRLAKLGKKIILFDEGKDTSSSIVAAGLANPFTGPKMIKSWKAEILFPALEDFYTSLQDELGTQFFRKMLIYRPFASIEELNDWEGRSAKPTYQLFIKNICHKNAHGTYVDDAFGGVEINGYTLHVANFVKVLKQHLEKSCNYVEERFDEEKLEVVDSEVRYGDVQAHRTIFCSGYQIQDSKYFGWLPIAPVKGEILTVRPDSDFETIYNKSCFIIPQPDGTYKAGSTYDRHDLSESVTEAGKNEITKKLDALLKMNYEIAGQQAGIRPGTVSRRPLIGIHPTYKNLSVFNGLGTKGVSLAPFFSQQFVKCLEEGNNLDSEVDIKRYYSLYFNAHTT